MMTFRDRYQAARARRRGAEMRVANATDPRVKAEAERDLARAHAALEVFERQISARDGDLTVRPRTVTGTGGVRQIG